MTTDYRTQFIQLALDRNVLCFGEFTLKSGRISPYFFNAGLFNTGKAIAELGRFYAKAIVESEIKFDVLFGPAYKGISLATVTAAALADHHGIDIPYAFNRKEKKDHGEGGTIVGAKLEGRVLIIDDVITAGTAIREAVDIIKGAGGEPCGVVIALNRQERGNVGPQSAIEQVEAEFNIPVTSIVTLNQLIDFLAEQNDRDTSLQLMKAYREKYGVSK